MHIKIQEYIKINRSGVSNRDKTEQVYCWDDAAWQQSTQPLGCRTKAGSRGGGVGCFWVCLDFTDQHLSNCISI